MLVKGFQATTIWKAFILNSIASTLVIFIAISIKDHFDNYSSETKGTEFVTRRTNVKSVILTLSVTFLSSMTAYILLYILFGFGRGMMAV